MNVATVQRRQHGHLGLLHLTPSLLFQLALNSFIDLHRMLVTLEDVVTDLAAADTAVSSLRRLKGRYQRACEVLESLIGGGDPVAVWASSPPLLDKLSETCWRLLQHKKYATDDGVLLCEALDKTRACLNKVSKALQMFPHRHPSNCPVESKQLTRALHRVRLATHGIGKMLIAIVPIFREDENVVFFLLRRHQALDEAFPKRSVSPVHSLFTQLYPNGASQVGRFLQKKYQRRGFHNLVPTIESLIEQLYSPPCPQSTDYTQN